MADEQVEPSVEEVKEAEGLGWAPKEKWRGAAENWVDAKTFLDRGRHILPIVQENNKRLSGQVQQIQGEVGTLTAALKAANATINALNEAHEADVEEQVKAAREELKDEIERASKDGDHAALAEATVKLTELNTAASGAEKPKEKVVVPTEEQPQIRPDVLKWYKDNPEFIADPRKKALAMVVAAEMRQDGDTSVGKEFLDKVADEVEKTLGGRSSSKAEAGNGGAGRRGGGGTGGEKTYADLPAEAKAACDSMSKRLVGPNRAHKDEASWRKSYTKQFFEG